MKKMKKRKKKKVFLIGKTEFKRTICKRPYRNLNPDYRNEIETLKTKPILDHRK